jgi:hypothetical protein
MAGPNNLVEGLTGHTLSAAGYSQTTSRWDRVVTAFAEKEGVTRYNRLGKSTRGQRLIEPLLHEVIGEISNISHEPPP